MIRVDAVYKVLIASLPIVDGILRIRLGAGWEPSVVFSFILCFLILFLMDRAPYARNVFGAFFVCCILLFFSNVFGYFFYAQDFILNSEQRMQIHSIEARMLVETVRYVACVFVFAFTYFYVSTLERVMKATCIFLYSACLEGVYGIYEFFVKFFGLVAYFPLLRGDDGNVHGVLRTYGTFFEPSNFGQFMACSFLLFLGFIQFSSQINFKGAFVIRHKFIFFAIFFVSVILSFSRTAFLGLLLGVSLKIFIDLLSGQPARIKSAVLWGFGFCALFLVGAFLVVNSVSEQYVGRWVSYNFDFSGRLNYENTALSRGLSIFEMLAHMFEMIQQFPMGIGQGMAYLELPFTPFLVRFPLEMGLISTIAFIAVMFPIAIAVFKRHRLIYFFTPGLACLCFCLVNYNSTNHIWLWFLFGYFLTLAKLKWVCVNNGNFSCYHHY